MCIIADMDIWNILIDLLTRETENHAVLESAQRDAATLGDEYYVATGKVEGGARWVAIEPKSSAAKSDST